MSIPFDPQHGLVIVRAAVDGPSGSVEPANETLPHQMIAKLDTPEARAIYGRQLAMVEPIFGHRGSW
jgi:hypothetical protein